MAAVTWFLLSAIITDLIGYWLHRWAHRPGSPLYRPHMTHHVTNYPAGDFTSETYRGAGRDSLAIWLTPFGLVYALLVLLACPHPWAALAGSTAIMVLSSELHDGSHVADSVTRQFCFLSRLVKRHLVHHSRTDRCFGILTGVWDRLFATNWPGSASRSKRRDPPR